MTTQHPGKTRWLVPMVLAVALCACGGGRMAQRTVAAPPEKPAMPSQVVYRIDDHRYFELTPNQNCYGDMVYFVDTTKDIRSQLVNFDPVMNRTTLTIDAANDQYLVAPVTRGGINCSSGGGACGERLPYSIDGGRTWRRAWYPGYGDDLIVSGPTVFRSYRIRTVHTDKLDLTDLPSPRDTNWKPVRDFKLEPRIAPVDTKVLCRAQGAGSVK